MIKFRCNPSEDRTKPLHTFGLLYKTPVGLTVLFVHLVVHVTQITSTQIFTAKKLANEST